MKPRWLLPVAILGVAAPSAGAAFSPARLVSGTQQLATDHAYDPAFSADSRYVAYAGSQAGVRGIYRKDLGTGALELVAGGAAAAPSISADGRRVAFTTPADLDPSDASGDCTSVYVRDMARAPGAPDAYELASARDGGGAGLAYADAAAAGCPGGGASAARGALAADGRRIAFTVVGSSDLATPAGETTTPPGQVAVRDLDARRTTLVSQTRASLGGTPEPVQGGAALAAPAHVDVWLRPLSASTATLSADGTTVAWMGIQIPEQAPVDPQRFPARPAGAAPGWYAEPLWRRIDEGPAAPTRRVLGGDDDPEACAGCAGPLSTSYDPTDAGDSASGNPVVGTFVHPVPLLSTRAEPFRSSLDEATPRLSADGRTVAVLSTQPSPAERTALDRGGNSLAPTANAFVVDMAPGLSRVQAVRRLTAWAASGFGTGTVAATGPVTSVALSPDGTRAAFTTARILFPHAPPALVTPPLSQVVATELYQANLAAGTLALASAGFDGAPADGDVLSPVYAGDSRTLAFSARAANLVYGAVNGRDNTSVFALTEQETPLVPGVPHVTPPPAGRRPAPRWVLSATARRARDGRLLIDVTVPGAGRVAVSAAADVPVRSAGRRAATGARRAGAPRSAPGRRRPRARTPRTRIARRVVARARTVAQNPGRVRVAVAIAPAHRALARRRRGLDATATVTFSAGGRAALRQTLPVRFLIKAPARKRGGRR